MSNAADISGNDLSNLRIGWVGTGIMGRPMCTHLLDAGFKVTVFNRSPEKAQALLDGGAAWAGSPREVARRSGVVFSIVGYPRDVREVYLGPDGILAGCREGSTTVDMTTTQPSLSVEIQEAAKARGVAAIDAPVSGSDIGAKNATLSIMVGGEPEAVEKVMPLLNLLGKRIERQGGPGAGQNAKMCNQIAIAGTMIGVCESLVYGFRAGLDLKVLLRSIGAGAAGSWIMENLAPRMIDHDFAPGFMVEHYIKDLRIALEECGRTNLRLPGLELAERLYSEVVNLGRGRDSFHALLVALERISGVEIGNRTV